MLLSLRPKGFLIDILFGNIFHHHPPSEDGHHLVYLLTPDRWCQATENHKDSIRVLLRNELIDLAASSGSDDKDPSVVFIDTPDGTPIPEWLLADNPRPVEILPAGIWIVHAVDPFLACHYTDKGAVDYVHDLGKDLTEYYIPAIEAANRLLNSDA